MPQDRRPRERTGGSDALQMNPQPFRTVWSLRMNNLARAIEMADESL
jgi:hypothetical protein